MTQSPASTATLDGSARGAHATVQRFWLTVTAGPDAGTRHASLGERVVVGTHESADLILRDETVSRFHCELQVSGSRVVVRDLGSHNGTQLDGVGVVEAYLTDGGTLVVGRTHLRFELHREAIQMPISEHTRFGSMVGASVPMRRAFALLERAAATDASVLLHGETGTGKEVAAESLHAASARRDGPFVVVDCGAIPPDLLEAELFGHEKGAFTGAVGAREGAFEVAVGGTVFLDEIGELSPALQPKLLRVLEKKQIKRVGSSQWHDVDVRIVAATNRGLRHEVNEKRFRSDLYYRLAVIEVRLPPLRERDGDLPGLVDHLLSSLGASDEDKAAMHSSEVFAEIVRHRFPGNVRELRNYLERCLTLRTRLPLGDTDDAGEEKLPDFDQPLKVARERWSRTFERRYVAEILQRSDDNVSRAARMSGIDRMHFYRLLWRHGLR